MGGSESRAGSEPDMSREAGREAAGLAESDGKPEGEMARELVGGMWVVDARMMRLARKRARHYPGTVRTAPKGPGESSLGTEEEDERLWRARVAAWRRSQGEVEAEETKG